MLMKESLQYLINLLRYKPPKLVLFFWLLSYFAIKMMNHGEQESSRCIELCETFLQIFSSIKFPLLYYQQYGNDVAVMSPSSRPGLDCEESWCVPVCGKGELHIHS